MIYSTLLYAVWKEEEEEGEGRPDHLNRSFRTSGRLTPRLDLNRKYKKKKIIRLFVSKHRNAYNFML